MIVVHVSGTPGTGKTFFGKRLEELFSQGNAVAKVVETDELITAISPYGIKLEALKNSDREKYKSCWAIIFKGEIDAAIEREKNKGTSLVVLVGILRHWEPNDGTILEIPEAEVKLYLDLSLEQLLKRFYGRYSEDLGNEKEFWCGVASDRYIIPKSTTVRENYYSDKKWHEEHDYQIVTDGDAFEKIKWLYSKLIK